MEITKEIVVQLIGTIADNATLIAQQAAKILVDKELLTGTEGEKAKNLILNNSAFKQLVRDATV